MTQRHIKSRATAMRALFDSLDEIDSI